MTEPKYPMPVLTAREREELIDELRLWPSDFPGTTMSMAAQITLAALTSEAAGSFAYHEDEDGDPTDIIVESDGFANNSFKLYTAPPVPVLKPVKLPEVEKWRKVDQVRAQMSYQHLVADSLIADGYEVKE